MGILLLIYFNLAVDVQTHLEPIFHSRPVLPPLRGGGKDSVKDNRKATHIRTIYGAQREWQRAQLLPANLRPMIADGGCFYRSLAHFCPEKTHTEWRHHITGRYGNAFAEEPDVQRGLREANLRAQFLTIPVDQPGLDTFVRYEGPIHGRPVVLINWTQAGHGLHFDVVTPKPGRTVHDVVSMAHDLFTTEPPPPPQDDHGEQPNIYAQELNRILNAVYDESISIDPVIDCDNYGDSDIDEWDITGDVNPNDVGADLDDLDFGWHHLSEAPELTEQGKFEKPHLCVDPAKCTRTDSYHLCRKCNQARFKFTGWEKEKTIGLIQHMKSCRTAPDGDGGIKILTGANPIECKDCKAMVSSKYMSTHKATFHAPAPGPSQQDAERAAADTQAESPQDVERAGDTDHARPPKGVQRAGGQRERGRDQPRGINPNKSTSSESKPNATIKVLSWNCQGLVKDKAEIEHILEKHKPDIVFFQESNLKGSLPKDKDFEVQLAPPGSCNTTGQVVATDSRIAKRGGAGYLPHYLLTIYLHYLSKICLLQNKTNLRQHLYNI